MNVTVHQSIVIHQFRVNSIADASVLIIGTAGTQQSLANSYNTGGFPTEGVPGKVAQESKIIVPLAPREEDDKAQGGALDVS